MLIHAALCSGASRSVIRGGAWNNQSSNARAAYRNNNNPDNRNNNVGLRVLCSPTSPRRVEARSLAAREFNMWADHGWPIAAASRQDGAGVSRPHRPRAVGRRLKTGWAWARPRPPDFY